MTDAQKKAKKKELIQQIYAEVKQLQENGK